MDLAADVAALEAKAATSAVEEIVLPTISAGDLVDRTPVEPDWLVPGLLARGWALMVSAREKTGKGTFIAYLIGCLENGTATCFGEACGEQMTALIFTEEPDDSTAEKARDSGLRGASYIFGWDLPSEIRSLPTRSWERWTATARALVNTAVAGGHSLLFVDNISAAAKIEDEAGIELARSVEILGEAAKRAGLTLIVDHHHRKSGGDMRDRSRGGTGAVGAVDVALSMDRGKDAGDRRRPLMCVGRRRALNWSKTIELAENGGSYEIIDQTAEEAGGGQEKSSLEQRRLVELREFNATLYAEQGEPWATADDIAGLWGRKASTVKAYLRDRVPSGEILEGPTAGSTKRYAASGWESADAMMTKPAF